MIGIIVMCVLAVGALAMTGVMLAALRHEEKERESV